MAACLALLIGASLAMPGIAARIQTGDYSGFETAASMYGGGAALGYIVIGLLAFYCTFGDILSNLIWCGMMMNLSFCAIRGLSYAKTRTGAARNMRCFHIGVLCFAGSEYLLWTAGCFWPDTSLASPTFWCDLLLTLAILGLLPAARKAVDA